MTIEFVKKVSIQALRNLLRKQTLALARDVSFSPFLDNGEKSLRKSWSLTIFLCQTTAGDSSSESHAKRLYQRD
jgi:hypothetical protein